jgi:two-component system cell cycle response regulator
VLNATLFPRVRDRRRRRQDQSAALLRISEAIDDYLYTNEHLPGGGRRSVFSGPNREKLMGGEVPPGGDVAREWERLIHPEDWDEHLAHRDRLSRGEPSEVIYRLRGYDGRTRWIHARTRSHREGSRLFVDGIVSDITARREAEEALLLAQQELRRQLELNAHQATHDPLTGLGNRRKLLADLEAVLADDAARERAVFVLCDLDGFKLYNDTFGHPAGDALLVRLGRRLGEAAATTGEAYRLGGDEFCVIARDCDDTDALGRTVSDALTDHGEAFVVTSAFGMCALRDVHDPGAALSHADQRLYAHKGRGRRSISGQVVDVLVAALEERDPDLGQHLNDVGDLAALVGRRLGLETAEADGLRHAARLHDIGKLAIPDEIIRKPAPLDTEEWTFMRQHPVIGERILATAPALGEAAHIVRSSHERFDGSGYPDGLRGREIPLAARIVAVCDAFDAMIGPRPYRNGISVERALAELTACAGTQFDPEVVAAFADVVRDGRIAA